MAYAAHQRGVTVVLRLTEVRARKLAGANLGSSGERAIVWKASRWDRISHPNLPSDAAVAGRLIAERVGRGKSKAWLYLFTTSALPAREVEALYGRRWNIETDLRVLVEASRATPSHRSCQE